MTWVKICGITNLEDALTAVDAGADALGFVFYDKSPRNIHPDEVRAIASRLPASTEIVGVFVGNNRISKRFIGHAKISSVQLHPSFRTLGDLPRNLAEISGKIVYAVSVDHLLNSTVGGFDWWPDAKKAIRAVLLDSGTPQRPGGTGVPFDWSKAASLVSQIASDFKVILAGGLNPDNVGEAMRILHPWGVDVSSGVEASPRKKDPEKVRAFIRAVRRADKANSN